jgi:thiamine biosynthesis lipoprotein
VIIRLALVLALAAAPAAATTQVHYVMGTYLRVATDDDVLPSALAGCFADVRALDRTFSRFDAASELARLNAAGGGPTSGPFRVTLAQAIALAHATGGAFDVSVGALTALWRAPARPDAAAVRVARRSVGGVAVDGERVVLAPGTRLDFDGFAKGVAVDACVDALRTAGVERALVSFGESSLYGLGAPRGAAAWAFEVRGPDPTRVVARLALRDAAAAISAVYGGAGRRSAGQLGHIVDPRSGAPLVEDAVSVVVTPRASDAEAWAKAVLVDGPHGVARAEASGEVAAARIGRDGIDVGRRLRASAAFHAFASPRAIPAETALR